MKEYFGSSPCRFPSLSPSSACAFFSGALASVSGFSSSLSLNLTSLALPPRDDSLDGASSHSGHSGHSGPSGDDEGAEEGRLRRALGFVGRGLVGIVATPLRPLVGAMGLVGRTAHSLSATVGEPPPSHFPLPSYMFTFFFHQNHILLQFLFWGSF